MQYKYFTLLCIFILTACAGNDNKDPRIRISTKYGNIDVELYAARAPRTVAAVLAYVDSGYYKNTAFYRVLNLENQQSHAPKAELIQGGLWKTNYKKLHSLTGIPHETTAQTNTLHKNGAISLARSEPGTAKTEFFICIGDQSGLNYGGENNPDNQGYAAFGMVVKGMDVVMKIYRAPEVDQAFDPPVYIYNIVRL